MTRMTGKRALVEMLRAEGVKYVFGNPGTTELPLMDALQDAPDVQYVTTLFEGVAAGMADGYARATQKPSFANLHISVGVANAIAVVYNAWRGGTPMVITAGQADSSFHLHSPTLHSNMVNVMREYTKWAGEVTHPWDVPSIIRRAFKLASTPPTGPVFVSLAWDAMNGEADVDIEPSLNDYFRLRPDTRAVEQAANVLAQASDPLILVGDRVSQSPGAPFLVARLAEQIGAPVYAPTTLSEVHIPTSHPHYLGSFETSWFDHRMKKRLDESDAVVAIGIDALIQFIPTPERPFSGPPKLVHVDSSSWAIQRSYPVAAGVLSDIKAGLEEITTALDGAMSASAKEAARDRGKAVAAQKQAIAQAFQARVAEKWSNTPISPERFAIEVARALPPGFIYCDDSITNRGVLMNAIDFDEPGSLFAQRGGSLGSTMGAALGIKLAHPDRPVVAVIGDGTAMYTIQALWTAAAYDIPVTYVFCNNSSYKVLREGMTRYLTGSERQSDYLGMDFYKLPLDFVKMAAAFNIEGTRVENPDDLGPALLNAVSSDKPTVVDVIMDDAMDTDRLQSQWGAWLGP